MMISVPVAVALVMCAVHSKVALVKIAARTVIVRIHLAGCSMAVAQALPFVAALERQPTTWVIPIVLGDQILALVPQMRCALVVTAAVRAPAVQLC